MCSGSAGKQQDSRLYTESLIVFVGTPVFYFDLSLKVRLKIYVYVFIYVFIYSFVYIT